MTKHKNRQISKLDTKWPPSHWSRIHPLIISKFPVDFLHICVLVSWVDFEIYFFDSVSNFWPIHFSMVSLAMMSLILGLGGVVLCPQNSFSLGTAVQIIWIFHQVTGVKSGPNSQWPLQPTMNALKILKTPKSQWYLWSVDQTGCCPVTTVQD